MKFSKIQNHIIATERICGIDFNANVGGEVGVAVSFFDSSTTFNYTRNLASLAYDTLRGVIVRPAPPVVPQVVLNFSVDGQPVPCSFRVVTLDGQDTYEFVALADQIVNIEEIVWADLEVDIDGETGIEVRIASDAPGDTRTYKGDAASAVYDVLLQLPN